MYTFHQKRMIFPPEKDDFYRHLLKLAELWSYWLFENMYTFREKKDVYLEQLLG